MDEAMNTSVEQTPTSDAFLEGLENAEGCSNGQQATVDRSEGERKAAKRSEDQPETEGSGACDLTGAEPDKEKAGDQTSTKPEGKDNGADTTADTKEGAEGAGTDPKKGPKEGQKEAAPPSWSIKHMGAERTITAAEVTPELLQKGMDYDRVRERYNEAKPVMEMVGQFAQKAGMSMTDYAKYIRAAAMRANGMSEAEAKRVVELEDREAAVSAKENYQQVRAAVKAKSKESIQADLVDFSKTFPDVYERAKNDPKLIPQSVWNDVNGGMSLTAAYSRYAITKANEQIKAAQDGIRVSSENHRNAQRSTGSMRSAGSDSKAKDPFLEGFGG